MSFFKLLSDKPEDYEAEECHEPADSYEIQQSELEDFLELTLDTGEQFCVPLDWLIQACRHNKFTLSYSDARESIH